MSDTNPKEITDEEWIEILQIREFRESWGIREDEVSKGAFPQHARGFVYGARFDFVSGAPGYCGDLFTLNGDALGEPMTLIRDSETGRLKVAGR